MRLKMELIDNTIGWLAQRGAVSDDALSRISKYAVVTPETTSKRIIYRDENSSLDPIRAYEEMKGLLAELGEEASGELEFCAGDAHGLATANTLAAMKAGVRRVHVSVGGVVPNGGAAMEEVLMCAKYFLDELTEIDAGDVAGDCAAILAEAGLSVPLNKAIIGRDIFAHESGIHVDGVLKNPSLYEVFAPGDVGLLRQLVVGKHSGRKTVRMKLSTRGINVSDEVSERLTALAKRLAAKQLYALTDEQLIDLYRDYMAKNGGDPCLT